MERHDAIEELLATAWVITHFELDGRTRQARDLLDILVQLYNHLGALGVLNEYAGPTITRIRKEREAKHRKTKERAG